MVSDMVQKLRPKAEGEVKQIVCRVQLRGAESKFCIDVDSASITVCGNPK